MSLKNQFKKIIDSILSSVMRDGRPILMEEIAGDLGISREYFSRLYNGKHDIRPKHIKDLMLRYPGIPDITSDITLEEENTRYDNGKKQKATSVRAYDNKKVEDLIESTVKLSDSNLINARNIDRLITMLETNSNASRGTSLATDPSFPKLIDLLWQIAKGTGKWEENQFRAMVASVIVPGDQVHDDRNT